MREHEPHLALFVDDHDPLLFYRTIGRLAKDALGNEGELWFEGHHIHTPAVAGLLEGIGFGRVSVLKDLSGNTRFIHARR